MPVITSKNHAVKFDYSLYQQPPDYEVPFTHSALGEDCLFSLYLGQHVATITLKATNGCMVISELRYDPLSLQCTPLLDCVQVKSIYTDAAYRGFEFAPLMYRFLLDKFSVVSDTIQTESGAKHWQVKMGSMDDLSIYIVENFPLKPSLMLDTMGYSIRYSFNSSSIDKSLVWGIENPDPRVILEGLEHSVTYTRDDVVLVAKAFSAR